MTLPPSYHCEVCGNENEEELHPVLDHTVCEACYDDVARELNFLWLTLASRVRRDQIAKRQEGGTT